MRTIVAKAEKLLDKKLPKLPKSSKATTNAVMPSMRLTKPQTKLPKMPQKRK